MKKVIYSVCAVALVTLAVVNVNLAVKSEGGSNLTLANILALANIENPSSGENYEDGCHLYNYGSVAETVRCQNDLGGGWYNWSVKRVCNITLDASKTCTPVECGVPF